ncbi:unnamed protein product [Schistocephalus solidus]|uniref:Uncharacterized protein n=1 Tax=Schistocephalus solidus TaxID=70667 RepID=A0A183SFA6_SCHSO|nr:unnamed protein product [Schistocephalus solidus]
MIRVLLQDCHLRLRKYNGVLSQAVTKCVELIGEDGVRLLQKFIDKRARDLRATRYAELMDLLRNMTHLSSKHLSPAQLKVLSHEACFKIADADPVNLVATVQSILKQTGESDETKYLIRQQICSLVMAHKRRAIISRAD